MNKRGLYLSFEVLLSNNIFLPSLLHVNTITFFLFKSVLVSMEFLVKTTGYYSDNLHLLSTFSIIVVLKDLQQHKFSIKFKTCFHIG